MLCPQNEFHYVLLAVAAAQKWPNLVTNEYSVTCAYASSPCSHFFPQGEINGHRGLVPSNFLEEVPDDVEVYLTDTPSHYPQEEPTNRPPANSAPAVSESKRVHHHRRSQR